MALARNRVVQDHVERRDAVGGDDEQLVLAHGVHVAHFAATQQRQGFDGGLMQSGGHESGLSWKERAPARGTGAENGTEDFSPPPSRLTERPGPACRRRSWRPCRPERST